MSCLICGGRLRAFLKKRFNDYGLGEVHYSRCEDCGFVLSDTHAEMSDAEWQRLNHAFHSRYQGQEHNPVDPNWIERLRHQADAICAMDRAGGIAAGEWLDYACGDGKLADYLHGRASSPLKKHDAFMARSGYLEAADLRPAGFDFVITTSVFEHLKDRASFDAIRELLAPGGVMGLHTLVCEAVPEDPDWFYFLPVHCAFHTNRSMAALMAQWGLQCSVYQLDARLWFLFTESYEEVLPRFERVRASYDDPAAPVWFIKHGFMDYWK